MKTSTALKNLARYSVRQNNKRLREQRKKDKEDAIANNHVVIEKFNNAVKDLVTLHCICREEIDWKSISETKLTEPKREKMLEKTAQNRLNRYRPNKFLKTVGIDKIVLLYLKKKVDHAKKKDEETYRKAMKEYQEEIEYLTKVQPIAARIMNGDTSSYTEVIDDFGDFRNIPLIGKDITFKVLNEKAIQSDLTSIGEDKIPTESARVLKSGKISTRKLTKTKFYELYQDHICSSALRVARELFAILPINYVIVNVYDNVLNTSTGQLNSEVILSVKIPRSSLNSLNFELLDPSDSLKNFMHEINFSKTKGFKAAKKIYINQIMLYTTIPQCSFSMPSLSKICINR